MIDDYWIPELGLTGFLVPVPIPTRHYLGEREGDGGRVPIHKDPGNMA